MRGVVRMTDGTLSEVLGPIAREERARGWWEVLARLRDHLGADLRPMAVVLLQVVVLTIVTRLFRIESPVFYTRILPLVAAGFVVHHYLPARHRLAAFAALSVCSIWLVFGVANTMWLLAIGGTLIAACHLPVGFRWRVLVLLALAVGLALMRGGLMSAPWTMALWPVLGSMFMFRLVAYMYDLRHQREPTNWARTLSYFFLLPNVAFPLFPVVDFNTFKRTHYDRPAITIYQQGVAWMARGLMHLLVYRLVYQYATLSPVEVTDTASLVRYLLANFGLYLRVSGQFHLIVGILHLFGFRLPETHRFFYLAGSFTDFWRRINIYWKDFMMKVVFYPVHFRVKRHGETTALVLGTLSVFVVTWFTHSYQWFWLLGTWLVSLTDTLFWGILAILLVVNSLREARRGRVRTLGAQQRPSMRDATGLALRTAGTFAVICVLWSLWTAPTLGSWWSMMHVARFGPGDLLIMLAPLVLVGVAAVVSLGLPRERTLGPRGTLALATVPLGIALAADRPSLAEGIPVPVRQVVRDLRSSELNRRDAAELQRGYYENIVGVNRFNGQLWEVYSRRTNQELPSLRAVGGLRSVPGPLLIELRPLVSTIFYGETFRTNRWGMRDQDYDSLPPPGTHRTAVLGQSYVMGSGVADGETFETLVEMRLRREPIAPGCERHEMLNFAMQAYSLFQQLVILENGRVAGLRPDAVLLVGHPSDVRHAVGYLVEQQRNGVVFPWPEFRELLGRAGVTPDLPLEEGVRRLTPYTAEVLERVFARIRGEAARHGWQLVYAMIPTPDREAGIETSSEVGAAELALNLASRAGIATIDMRDVYEGSNGAQLWVWEGDHHPNAAGHRMIASRLYAEMAKRPAVFCRHGAP